MTPKVSYRAALPGPAPSATSGRPTWSASGASPRASVSFTWYRPGEAAAFSTTHDPGGAAIGTELADASVTCLLHVDSDGDGCLDSQDLALGFNPLAWYDFYDVPVPARADANPNGPRNRVVDIADVLGVLFYAFAKDNQGPNANGVDYDTVKGSCTIGGVPDQEEGLCYDRSPGAEPNPPWDAGPPNGVIDMADVLGALAQTWLNCGEGP